MRYDDPSYPFAADFQLKLFASVVRDEQFLRRFTDVLKPAYFTNDFCRVGMGLVKKYFETYHGAPGIETFQELVDEEFRRKPPSKDVRQAWVDFVEQVRTLNLSNLRFIQDSAVQWAKDQILVQYVLECSKIIETARRTGERDYGKMRELLNEALKVGQGTDDTMADYFESTSQRMRLYHHARNNKIPTFMAKLDQILEGGLDRGEEGVIVAPPSRGKTTALIQIGVGGVLNGSNVLAVSAEMSQLKFEMRVDRYIAGMARWEIAEDPDEAMDRIEMVRKFKGRFKVYEYPSRKCSVEMIYQLIERLKDREGFITDLILVDYGSILQPSAKYADRRYEISGIFREMRDLAKETHAGLWSAHHSNRGSFNKSIITMQDLAECYDIGAIVDVMFAICQTPEERKESICRWFTAKNRDAEDSKTIKCEFDRQRAKFHPIDWVTGMTTERESA